MFILFRFFYLKGVRFFKDIVELKVYFFLFLVFIVWVLIRISKGFDGKKRR